MIRNNNIHLIWLALGAFALAYIYGNRSRDNSRKALTDSPFANPLSGFENPVATPEFDGTYKLVPEESFKDIYKGITCPEQLAASKKLLEFYRKQFNKLNIAKGVITCGEVLIQEYRITEASVNNGVLNGKAIFHEDIHDPGDCCVIGVQLELKDNTLKFRVHAVGGKPGEPVVFTRITSPAATGM